MHKALFFIMVLFGIGLIGLGIVFLMAYEDTIMNVYLGAVMVVIGILMMAVAMYDQRRQAGRPVSVQATYNVTMGGSGGMKQRQLVCKSCAAPLTDKDLKMIDGGMMYTCSYCGSSGTFEEAPKW